MKRISTLIIFTIITVVAMAQNNYAVYDNKVYEISYNENGNRTLTELGKVESMSNTNKKWKLSGNISAGVAVDVSDSHSDVISIYGMASIGGRFKNILYIGAGTGIVNNTVKWKNFEGNYCAVPVFAEVNANTNSSRKVDFYGNLKIGTDIITSDRYTYDGNAIFTTRITAGIMICKHITVGATYTFQSKYDSTGHAVGGTLSFIF